MRKLSAVSPQYLANSLGEKSPVWHASGLVTSIPSLVAKKCHVYWWKPLYSLCSASSVSRIPSVCPETSHKFVWIDQSIHIKLGTAWYLSCFITSNSPSSSEVSHPSLLSITTSLLFAQRTLASPWGLVVCPRCHASARRALTSNEQVTYSHGAVFSFRFGCWNCWMFRGSIL